MVTFSENTQEDSLYKPFIIGYIWKKIDPNKCSHIKKIETHFTVFVFEILGSTQ